MNIQKIINDLSLIINVIPDYTEGIKRGLTYDETEEVALKAVTQAANVLEDLEIIKDKCLEFSRSYKEFVEKYPEFIKEYSQFIEK